MRNFIAGAAALFMTARAGSAAVVSTLEQDALGLL
jgi:hypothetical protein